MRRLLFLLLLAVSNLSGGTPQVTVRIDTPPPGQPAFDLVQVAATVVAGEPVAEVSMSVDGKVFARLRRPPFEAAVDVGPENVPHRFEVVATTLGGQSGRAELLTPRIETDAEMVVELRQLYVTVRRAGTRALDLSREDFTILDNGSPQRIVTFARGDIPFTAALLLDSSISMRGERIRAAIEGARAFVQAMRPLDEARLVVFSDRLLHGTPFLGDPAALLAGLQAVHATGGTSANDHLFLALAELEARQGRRVVVLLSDGTDTHSALSMREVMRKVRESRALVYWIRLESEVPMLATDSLASPWHDGAWYRQQLGLLADAAAATGGRVVPVRRPEEIAPAFAEIVRELREQYVLGYYPTRLRHDGSWRKVAVKVTRGQGGFEVQARDGYLDE